MNEQDLRYPVGRFIWPASVTVEKIASAIQVLDGCPAEVKRAVSGLNDAQLDTPYRPGGWTVRQVVHHLADSHVNSYQRFRLALTEDQPTINAYKEAAWAELPDAKSNPIAPSIAILEGLHERWVALLRNFEQHQWARAFVHPERGSMRLDIAVTLYAWHSRHHLAHIQHLREREKW